MNHYLIDFENVGCDGMKGIECIADDDIVTVFYNDTCKMFINDILAFRDFIDRVEFKLMKRSGSNYLDFYLSATVGRLMAMNPDAAVVIVSKDKGYASVLDFCEDNGLDCRRFISIKAHIDYVNSKKRMESAECGTDGLTETRADDTIETAEDVVAVTEETQVADGMADAVEVAAVAEVVVAAVEDMPEEKPKEKPKEKPQEKPKEKPKKQKKAAPTENVKRTVPEPIRKKVRAALSKDRVETHKYIQIYKAFLAPNKKGYLERLTNSFGKEKGQNFYNKTLQFYKEFLGNGGL